MTESINVTTMEEEPLQTMKDLTAQWADYFKGVQHALEEKEQLRQRVTALESENAEKDADIDRLNGLLEDKDRQLTELRKVSASMAKKSSQDDVAKAIRIYLNTSKRKKLDKREAAKDSFALDQGVSANQATYIAMLMAERLGLKKKWKPFQELWGIPNMAQMAGAWQQTGKLPPDAKRIDELLE